MPLAVVIINPGSGPVRRPIDGRVLLARDAFRRHGYDVEVVVTTARGDAREGARRARAAGAAVVAAWGGDGTLNEVGSALAFSQVPMAIVPGGSGNGLARELGIPLDPARALEIAATGRRRVIDAGSVDDSLFFNVAGVGLDALIAERLTRPGARRGLRGYVQATCAELPRYRAVPYTVQLAQEARQYDAWFVAMANSQQYGNGARIAPAARLDDGILDLVVVEAQPLWRLVQRIPALFRGTLEPGPGLHMAQTDSLELVGASPITFHTDGEPCRGGTRIRARVRPGALIVVCP
ncbi:MAG: diacylglycerol kinase family lipid kinase [Vicinamibacterales bacterium]